MSEKKYKKSNFKSKYTERMTDASHQDDFIFNKTPILASALKKLKTKASSTNHSNSAPKRANPKKSINLESELLL